MFSRLSPREGEIDDDALDAAYGEDPDATLALLADIGAVGDDRLRSRALRLAGRLALDLGRGANTTRRGVDRMASRRYTPGAEIDLDRGLETIAVARRLGAPVDVDRLHGRSWIRREHAISLLVDRSGSMGGARLIAAALAAAVVSTRAPQDHSVIAFAGDAVVVKAQDRSRSPERVIDDLLSLRGYGTTDLALGLRACLIQLARSTSQWKVAVVLSDCEVTAGADPLVLARRFDALHVITPPDSASAGKRLAAAGSGKWAALERPTGIPEALMTVLG